MKDLNARSNDRGTLKYKATTTPDGKTDIEFVMDMNISTASTVHQVWYDMGDGSHVRSDDLEKLTEPYGG